MAQVYLAYDPRFKREVALKLLPQELMYAPAIRARFEQEAQTVAALDHPAIVPVYDFGEQEGQLYLVMRYMAGGSLGDRLGDGPLSLSEVQRIVSRIAPALDEAHQKGVIHRDIKPGNILFDHRDEPALADFGIVRLAESTVQLTGSGWVGTPAFMAPEMGDPGGVTPLVDIYALGVTVYMMLSGQHPYEADTPSAYIVAHISKPVPDILALRPDLPLDTQAVIERAMAKSPADRYQSAGGLAAGLREAAAQELPVPTDEATLIETPVEPTLHEATSPTVPDTQAMTLSDTPPGGPTIHEPAPPPPTATRMATPSQPTPPARRGFPLWVVGVLGLVIVLGLAFAFWPRGDEAPATPAVVEPTDEPLAAPVDESPAVAGMQELGTRVNPIVWSLVLYDETMTSSAQEITDLLFAETGLYVEMNVATDYAGVVEAMCSDPPGAQMASLPPFAYIVAADRGCAEAALVAVRFGSSFYNGQIITRADGGISSITDLAGRTFCRPDLLSASGWIIPSLTMRADGLDPETDLAAVVDAGGHDAVVAAVYNGSCDAGSTYVDARSTVEGEFPDVMDVVTVIEVTVDIPNDGIQFNPSIPQAQRNQIVDGLLAIAGTEEGVAALETMYSWSGLEKHGDEFYDPLRQELQAVGLSAEGFLE